MDEACRFGPIAIRWRTETACPRFCSAGGRVWPEVAPTPRRPHESRHQLPARRARANAGARGLGRRPRRQRWRARSPPLESVYLFGQIPSFGGCAPCPLPPSSGRTHLVVRL